MYKVIVTDFDDVMNNLLCAWVDTLNNLYNCSVKYNEIKEWDMSKSYPTLTHSQIVNPLTISSFWEKVTPKEDAIEYLYKLKEEQNRVVVATSTYYEDAQGKFNNCLFKHFPFLNYRDIIITYQKDLIKCDYLIDDYEHNLKYSSATRLLFDTCHNQNCNIQFYDYRVYNWKQIYDIVKEGKIRCKK